MLTYIQPGNILEPIGPGIVAHLCNVKNRWGAGVSGAIGQRWPAARLRYRKGPWGLGACQIVEVGPGLAVANLLAQRDTGLAVDMVDYEALERALRILASDGRPVHLPKIGAGLARGNWGRIEALIREILPVAYVYLVLARAPQGEEQA